MEESQRNSAFSIKLGPDFGVPILDKLTRRKPLDSNVSAVLNLSDIKTLAKQKLPKNLYEYFASGSGDEQTLLENCSRFKMWYLRPRMLRSVGSLNTKVSLFGDVLQMPVFASPTGMHALADVENGECATARACGRVGTLYALSQNSTRCIEDVASAAPDTNKWYQSYILKDRKLTLNLVKRAVEAGYKGIFLTVDSVRFGYREADDRNEFDSLPSHLRLANYEGSCSSQETYNQKKYSAFDQNLETMLEQELTWDDVRWLKEKGCAALPLIVKGIMTAEDALLAIDAGADGVMVSNHGGRQLDGALSGIDALPEVARAVNGRVPVLLDGGIRRGTDIIKALALGATAVGLGRPVYYSLAIGGEDWVVKIFQLLKTELERAMALCGCSTIKDINSDFVCRSPTGNSLPYTRSVL